VSVNSAFGRPVFDMPTPYTCFTDFRRTTLGAQSAPRNVFCGHLIGVVAGYLALIMFGLTTTPTNLSDITAPRIGAVTICLCLTLSFTVWLNVPHAPAGATALIVGLGLMRTPAQLTVLMIAVVLLIGQSIAINRLAMVPYPWWAPLPAARLPSG
jgi:hypothetical protein